MFCNITAHLTLLRIVKAELEILVFHVWVYESAGSFLNFRIPLKHKAEMKVVAIQ